MRAVSSSRDRLGRRTGARARRAPRTLGSVVLAEGRARPAGSESLLAIMTNWALFAGFGVCFVLSGLVDSDLVTGLIGFASFLAGFGAHIIINRIFASGFTGPQVALALGAFTAGVLCFIVGALFDPGFTATDLVIGIAGFGALVCGFMAYVLINYGIQGSYEMLHQLHRQERRAS
jgi:hypothetical protein